MVLTSADLMLGRTRSWYFIKNFCVTWDEHDSEVPELKPWPDWDPHSRLSDLLDEKMASPGSEVILVPKSRQVMVSWVSSGFILKMGIYRPNSRIVIQSLKEEFSVEQLKRVKYMYENLPKGFRDYSPLDKPMSKQREARLSFANGTIIDAIAQGKAGVRSLVPTFLFSDESAFQPEFEESFAAALRCCHLILAVSSPNPGHFQKLVEDTDGGDAIE